MSSCEEEKKQKDNSLSSTACEAFPILNSVNEGQSEIINKSNDQPEREKEENSENEFSPMEREESV